MGVRIALAGNPNCGKTTMFNSMTGANQYVGNWPGVTVEKKEGRYTRDKEVVITDLPGVYSLSPYSPEEVVTRDVLLDGQLDAVINLVDATNLERNLYLTTQIVDLGVPVVVALNMMDLVEKNGDKIDIPALSEQLGCPVVPTSALKGKGLDALVAKAREIAAAGTLPAPKMRFDASVEEAVGKVIDVIGDKVSAPVRRWFAIKALEGEQKSIDALKLSAADLEAIAAVRSGLEESFDDDIESIVTSERYGAIAHASDACVKRSAKGLTTTQKIDRVVTNRWLGIPIFIVVMAFVYWLAITIGTGPVTDWANDGISGDGWLYTGGAEYEEAVGAWEEELAAAEEAGDEALAAQLAEQEPDPSEFGLFIPGERRTVASEPGGGRHRCRRGRGHRLHSADDHLVPAAGIPGKLRVLGACCLHHGPHLPSLRPFGQKLHPHAHRVGLRRACRHGHQDHRERKRPSHDHHDHHDDPLWREDAHHRAGVWRDRRRRRRGHLVDHPDVLLPGCARHHRVGHHVEEDAHVRRRGFAVRHGAACLPSAYRSHGAHVHVGAHQELRGEGGNDHLPVHHRHLVPHELRRVRGSVRTA